jgi:hypothetical protein
MVKTIFRRAVYVVLALVVLCFGAVLWIGSVADERLTAELAAIRERGEPIELIEMAPPPVPDEENAAGLLALAAAKLAPDEDNLDDAHDALRLDPAGLSDENATLLSAFVERNKAALDQLETALERPRCRFAFDYTSGESLLELDAPDISALMTFARLLGRRGLLAVRAGEGEAAYEDALRMFRLARMTGSDPILILALVRMSMEAQALDLLEHALRMDLPGDAVRERLIAVLDGIDVRESLHRSLLGERCFGHSLFAYFSDDRGSVWKAESVDGTGLGGSFGLVLFRFVPGPIIRLDEARYMKIMAEVLDLVRRPAFETREQWRALEAEYRELPWYGLLSKLVVVPFARSVERSEAHRARLDMARIALDLMQARALTGTLPDTLLRPGEGGQRGVIDPFTGTHYRYKVNGAGGFILYSLGPNEADDGGTDGSEEGHESGDVIWRR